MLQSVGRYQVRERIGEGAMADVYRAYDPGIGRDLAIKVLKGEFRQNPQYAQRFLREAKAAGALSHPSIVTIYDVGEVDGYPYIAMELLDGRPLDQVLSRDGKLPADVALGVALQLAEGLAYAHGLGVVHRDIKPSNIMLLADGRTIKILDFGIARVAEAELSDAESLKTQIGQVLGTPRYMSPEQALGRELDGRSDLFSLGVVLYELVTGRRAFAGSSAATLALQITQQEPSPLAEIAPETPRGLQFIIGKLLAKRPERRFADGAQVADALRRELKVYDAVQDEGAGSRRRLSMQLRLALAMAGITAVVFGGASALVLNQQYAAMEKVALTSGSAIATFVAANAALSAADNAALPEEQQDWAPVEAFVKAAAADPNVRQMTVVDADNIIRAATNPALVGRVYVRPEHERVVSQSKDLTVSTANLKSKDDSFRFVRSINYAGQPFGRVDVSVSKTELTAAAGLAKGLMAMLGLVTLGAVVAVAYTAARLLSDPVRRLRNAFADATRGDLDFRLSHQRTDEFGELFDGFNRYTAIMQERIENTEALLQQAASALDRTVARGPHPVQPDATRIAPQDRTVVNL